MSLIDYYKQTFLILEHTETEDGEGGRIEEWTPNGSFIGALVLDTSQPVVIAESSRLGNSYTLTVSRNTELPFKTVFRAEDGSTYRILSGMKQTPSGFTDLDIRQYKAERWEVS